MKRLRRAARQTSVQAAAAAVMVAALAGPAFAGVPATPQGPTVKLAAAQENITVQSTGGVVILDPGIYVISLGSALKFDVQRASYSKPVTITQVIHLPGGSLTRPWPSSVLDGFYGLRDFARLTVTDSSGKVVASSPEEFCPNSYAPQRAVPTSAQKSPFPQECAVDPFAKSLVMGIARGWGVDPFLSLLNLAPGRYRVTAAVTRRYRRLLHMTSAGSTTTVHVTVVNGPGSSGRGAPASASLRTLAPSNKAPTLKDPPAGARPDLVSLPAWQISTSHTPAGQDLLNFAATVWVGGYAPLDVEGFRVLGTPVMKAYQYFWRNGHVIGRARVGTMGFAEYNSWHFKQFAKYALLNSAKKLAAPSHKEGFCISPTDPVDLLAPHAVWQPPSIGLSDACGQPTALWAREMLPVGWGDTYFQSIPGQSFDITKIPNGTYYIQIVANPGHHLYESNTGNNISLRKVILGGTAGHRTVKVPDWNGIDPESKPR